MATFRLTHSAAERSLQPFHPIEHAAKHLAMTYLATLLAADRGQKAHPIHLVDKKNFEDWAKTRPAEDRALLKAHRFDGKSGFAFVILPRRRRNSKLSSRCGCARLVSVVPCEARGESARRYVQIGRGRAGPAALGWLLAQHRFDAYRSRKQKSLIEVRGCL